MEAMKSESEVLTGLEVHLESLGNLPLYDSSPSVVVRDEWSKYYRANQHWFKKNKESLPKCEAVIQKVIKLLQDKSERRTKLGRCRECGAKLVSWRCLACDLNRASKANKLASKVFGGE